MFRLFRLHIPKPIVALGVCDAAVLYVAVWLGYFIGLANSGRPYVLADVGDAYLQLLFVAACLVSLVTMGLYHRQFIADLKIAFIRMSASFALAFLALSIIFYIFPATRIWMSALLPAFLLGFGGTFMLRVIFARVFDADMFRRRIVVFGASSQAERIARLEKRGGFRCVGFLRVGTEKPMVPASRVLRHDKSLIAVVREQQADEIVVALTERRGALPTDELLECRLKGVAICDFSTFVERQTGQVELESLRPSWMIFAEGFSYGSRLQAGVKRSFDVVVGLLLLLFTLPVTLLTAAAIIVSDRGPVFYRQERVGLAGQTFELLKFRSMRVDAEMDGVARWAETKDPRITAIGSFIRLTRIDEIPQVYNVLRGEMSFIGPRPERPTFVSELSKEIPFYEYREMVKPGITGWAQINYPYGASVEDAREKLKFDLFYIKNYSLVLDFVILLQTVRVVLWPQGAR